MDRTRRLILSFLVVSCLLAPLAGVARGQSNSYAQMLDTTRTLQGNLFDEMNRVNAQRSQSDSVIRGSQASPQPRPPTMAHLPLSVTDFIPVDGGHPLLDQYVDGLSLVPRQRATVRRAVLQTWSAIESKTRRNNVATSIGVAVAASMLVLTGRDTDDAQMNEQIARINDFLAGSSLWFRMSRRGKQQLSDSFMLTTSVMLVFAQAGRSDLGSRQASIAIARDLLSRVGVAAP